MCNKQSKFPAVLNTKTTTQPQDKCLYCKSRCLWFLVGLRMLKWGNNRAERGEKASDTRRVLSFKSVTQADGAMWEISFGWGLHGLDPICCAPSVPTPLTTKPQPLYLLCGDRQAHERSAWIAYGGVPFKTPKQFPSDLLRVCFGSSLVPLHPKCSSRHATPVNPP